MTLNGYDIAGVNGSGIIDKALTGAFTICKATEGITFNDPLHDQFCSKLRAAGKLVGHYHYARPDNPKGPAAEADHFIARANPRPGEVMALDFEPYESHVGVTDHTKWPEYILSFCGRVQTKTGTSCWVYLNDWFANEVFRHATTTQDAALRRLPLWKAGRNNAYPSDPSGGPGDLHGWPVCTCWQWSGTGIDKDIFYGDAATWSALGAYPPATPPTPEDDMSDADVKAINDYTRDLLLDGYTTGGAFHLGVAKVVEENQARITAVGEDVDALAGDVASLATAVAALPAPAAAEPVTDEQLERVLRKVLGSLDEPDVPA